AGRGHWLSPLESSIAQASPPWVSSRSAGSVSLGHSPCPRGGRGMRDVRVDESIRMWRLYLLRHRCALGKRPVLRRIVSARRERQHESSMNTHEHEYGPRAAWNHAVLRFI